MSTPGAPYAACGPGPGAAAGDRAAWWWAALLLVAAFAYLNGLDGQHLWRIGDELPYAQVTRTTAASGEWLPLKAADPHLENTKPPLLFWLGIVATDGGEAWSLWRLRLPVVLVTFACALLVVLVGRRLAGTAAGLLAAVVFLGCASTFRYGRPFLTNLPETLFVFGPLALAVGRPERLDRAGFWVVATVGLGLACWVKSFALVVPVGLAYAWWLLMRRGWRWGEFLRRDAAKVAGLVLGGLGLFALWFVADPEPGRVWEQFVLRENLGKVGAEGGYLKELVGGRHSVWRTWFGHVGNVGFYAPLLVGLAIASWRGRRTLTEPERALWVFVLAFLVAYTFPTHRQENYLLPTVPALALLLALRWQAFGAPAWRLTALSTLAAGLAACGFVLRLVAGGVGIGWSDYGAADLAVPVLVVAASAAALARWTCARFLVPGAVLLAYGSIAAVTAPFEGPKGRFPAEVREATRSVVYVPHHFRAGEEAYRFLLPHASPVPYDPKLGMPRQGPSPSRFDLSPAVLRVDPGATPAPETHPRLTWVERGRRLTLQSRPDSAAVRALVLEGRLEGVVRDDVLMAPTFR